MREPTGLTPAAEEELRLMRARPGEREAELGARARITEGIPTPEGVERVLLEVLVPPIGS